LKKELAEQNKIIGENKVVVEGIIAEVDASTQIATVDQEAAAKLEAELAV